MYSLDHLSARAAESERQTIQQQTEVCNKKISNLFFHELGKKETVNRHIKNANSTCIIFADHSESLKNESREKNTAATEKKTKIRTWTVRAVGTRKCKLLRGAMKEESESFR